jgi:hypothetical protein
MLSLEHMSVTAEAPEVVLPSDQAEETPTEAKESPKEPMFGSMFQNLDQRVGSEVISRHGRRSHRGFVVGLAGLAAIITTSGAGQALGWWDIRHFLSGNETAQVQKEASITELLEAGQNKEAFEQVLKQHLKSSQTTLWQSFDSWNAQSPKLFEQSEAAGLKHRVFKLNGSDGEAQLIFTLDYDPSSGSISNKELGFYLNENGQAGIKAGLGEFPIDDKAEVIKLVDQAIVNCPPAKDWDYLHHSGLGVYRPLEGSNGKRGETFYIDDGGWVQIVEQDVAKIAKSGSLS